MCAFLTTQANKNRNGNKSRSWNSGVPLSHSEVTNPSAERMEKPQICAVMVQIGKK